MWPGSHPRDALVGGPGQRPDLGRAEEPLVRHAEDQLLATPPAGGIAMAVRGPREEQAALLQPAGDRRGGVDDRRPRQGPQAVEVASLGIHRGDDGQPVPAAEVEVLEAAARRDVNDAGALRGGHLLPRDHPMLHVPLDGQIVERPDVPQPHELGALDGAPRRAERGVASGEAGGDVVDGVRERAFDVVELRVNRHRHVGRQRPRRRGPHEEPVVGAVPEGQGDGHRLVGELGIGVQHLVLRDRGAAPRAPRHRTMPHVEPAPLVAPLQEGPVALDVGVGHREVGAGPVHPLAELL